MQVLSVIIKGKYDDRACASLASSNEELLFKHVKPNPDPAMQNLEEFLKMDQQVKFMSSLNRNINDLHKKVLSGKIPKILYTGSNLMILNALFNLACTENYCTKIMDKMEKLSTHWYKVVRSQEKKKRETKKAGQRKYRSSRTHAEEDPNGDPRQEKIEDGAKQLRSWGKEEKTRKGEKIGRKGKRLGKMKKSIKERWFLKGNE